MIYEETIDGRHLVLEPSRYNDELHATLDGQMVATIRHETDRFGRWQYRVIEWPPTEDDDFGVVTLYTLDNVWERIQIYAMYNFLPHLQ